MFQGEVETLQPKISWLERITSDSGFDIVFRIFHLYPDFFNLEFLCYVSFSTKKSHRSLKKNAISTLMGTSPFPLPRLPVDVNRILTNFIVTEKEENFKNKDFCSSKTL